jgi:predicted dehydrogenase
VQTGSFEDLIGPRGVIDIQGLKTLTLKTRGGEEIFDDLDADMYAKQLQAFARSIREDLPVPASAEDALAALKVSLAVIESARTHEVVKL